MLKNILKKQEYIYLNDITLVLMKMKPYLQLPTCCHLSQLLL